MARNQSHPNFLESSRTLVLGGTSGIGFAVASAALANGSAVYVSSSDTSKVTHTISDLNSLYPSQTISGMAADLSTTQTMEATLKAVLDAAVKNLGKPLDHIVVTSGNNFERDMLSEFNITNGLSGFTVRYLGPLMLSKLLASNPGVYLNVSARSSITLTSGIAGQHPRPGYSTFVGVAGAIEALTRSLSVDLAPIRVNVVLPGAIKTELFSRLPPSVETSEAEKTLVKAVGKPEEAAEAYVFSMRCAFLTGQELVVDGGCSLL